MTPREEEILRLVRQWLKKAEEDLGVAQHLLAQQTPFLSAIGFHAQQVVEKFLKALLVRHQIEFRKTHDLGELLDLIQPTDPSASKILRGAIILCSSSVDF